MRKDWNHSIQKDDVVVFTGVAPGYVLAIVLVIVAIVLAVAMPLPVTPGQQPASDPVFSVKGQNNQIRLGEPIEVLYGKTRSYPALASRPFYEYIDNDQFQHSLFCLGQGEFQIEEVMIGDTAITEYEEASYEIIPPGGTPTLFPSNVYTSAEAGGQTLYSSDEAEYIAPGWVGPFPANPSSTETNFIQVDLIFPQGLYVLDSKGSLSSMTITVEIEARTIDDFGSPTGSYFPLLGSNPLTITAATTTPQRKTYSANVTSGRYEVRIRRTDLKDTSANVGHTVSWEGLRSYLDINPDFGNVTLLAVKIRATANLNERTQTAFNVVATRKLPIYESGGWSAPQATRSIIWAFFDVFRSAYGGRIEVDSFFDIDTLLELDALYESRGDYFDWIFRDPITVWEAAQTIARAGRGIPLLIGSLITIKRDAAMSIPVALFGPDNIVRGSFQWNVVLWQPNRNDGVRITYTEPSTGYKQEQITCVLPGFAGDNPKDVQLPGVSVRAQAYREGLFMAASERYLRENIVFDTGMEGHIPVFGDLIAISHDVPRWGQSGVVVHAEFESGDVVRLWLSEPVDWSSSESGEHQIMLKGAPSTIIGPLSVTATADDRQVLITLPGDESSGNIDFLLSGTTEPMIYLFGVSGRITKYGKVVKVEPQSGETVRITAVNDEPIIHSFDDLAVPPLTVSIYSPVTPDLPEIAHLYLTQINGPLQIIQVSWTAAFGAQRYIVRTSEDGENYQDRATTNRTSVQLQVRPGDLWVRVAAINNGQGPWIEETINVGLIVALTLSTDWVDLEWQVQWELALSEIGYVVRVYDNTVPSAPVLKRTTSQDVSVRFFDYTYAMAVTDGNLHRDMLVEVTPQFTDGSAVDPTGLELHNDIPTAPGSPASSLTSVESDSVHYHLSWTIPVEDDLIRIKVWLSDVNGFDPGVVSPTVDTTYGSPGHAGIATSANIAIPLESGGNHPTYYWRVAIFDVWGNEIATNITAQQTIAAYP